MVLGQKWVKLGPSESIWHYSSRKRGGSKFKEADLGVQQRRHPGSDHLDLIRRALSSAPGIFFHLCISIRSQKANNVR